jgi:ABC-type branched-subunit amino acid transport system substrate-binding protein
VSLRRVDPDGAIERFRSFLVVWPESPLADDAGLNLAELLLERGDEDEALQVLHRVVQDHPMGDRSDLARLELTRLLRARGHPEAAYRTASAIRSSRLPRAERRELQRLLASLSGDQQDPVNELLWLVQVREETVDEDERALLDVDIDALIQELEPTQLEQAAQELGARVPAARIRLRLAELALAAGDRAGAEAELEQVRRLPLGPYDERRLGELEIHLGLGAAIVDLPPALSELGLVPAPDPAAAAGTLGVVVPLSGDFALFGEQSLQGVLLAAGLFDATAPGASGIRVRVSDSRGTEEGAEAAVRELAEDPELLAIVGPLSAAEAEGAARAAQAAEIPVLTLSRRRALAAQRTYVFRLGLTPATEMRMLAEYATEGLGAARFAILYPGDRYGATLKDLFWAAIEAHGGEVVGLASYDPQATDFAEPIRSLVGFVLLTPEEQAAIKERDDLLDRAKRLPPEAAAELREEASLLTGPDEEPLPPIVDFDVLFIPDSYENVGLIAPQLAFHGIEGVRLLGTSGWNHPELVEIGMPHVEGAIFTASYHGRHGHPLVSDFAARFEASFGAPAEVFAALGFDAATLVLEQWARGATSREAIALGLLGVRNRAAVAGPISIAPDGNAVRRPHLLTVQQGRIISLD